MALGLAGLSANCSLTYEPKTLSRRLGQTDGDGNDELPDGDIVAYTASEIRIILT